MSKKHFFIGVALVLALVSVVLVGRAYSEENAPSNEEIAMAYVVEKYGEGDWEIEIVGEINDGGLVYCNVFESGNSRYILGIDTDYYAYLVE